MADLTTKRKSCKTLIAGKYSFDIICNASIKARGCVSDDVTRHCKVRVRTRWQVRVETSVKTTSFCCAVRVSCQHVTRQTLIGPTWSWRQHGLCPVCNKNRAMFKNFVRQQTCFPETEKWYYRLSVVQRKITGLPKFKPNGRLQTPTNLITPNATKTSKVRLWIITTGKVLI